jgi:DNA topoisomerase I
LLSGSQVSILRPGSAVAKKQPSRSCRETAAGASAAARTGNVPPGLRYIDDSCRGYTREWIDGAFVYFDTEGARLKRDDEIRRINALAVPPA